MQLEELKAGSKVWDDQAPEFGEGIILIIDDDLIDVHFPNIEETVGYTTKEGLKYLNLLL